MKITFVCCPKPFIKEYKDIQNNAIRSWTKLSAVDKIVVCGDEEGVEEYVKELKNEINKSLSGEGERIIYKKSIKRNEFNTPLVDRLFKIGTHTDNKYVCYINADIILLQDFQDTFAGFLKKYPRQNLFLLVGKRWDWKNPEAIDFSDEEWQQKIKEKALADGELHAATGIDYFLHTCDTFPKIHPFALGKFFWDNWVVGNAFKRTEVKTVDITESVFAIHQDSPWYVKESIVYDRKAAMKGEEAIRNKSYDRYGRHIDNGTRFKSYRKDDGSIDFENKNYVMWQ